VEAEERLGDGWGTEVARSGDLVLRGAGPQSKTVVAFLRHLHAHGVDFVPEPVGSGFASDGREQLRFIPGAVQHPRPWPDEAMSTIGRMLRQVHEATSSFTPPVGGSWRPSFFRTLPGGRRVMGHSDLGPWNILARDDQPVAFIDWDDAGPIGHLSDLANVAWLNAQLHDDDVADINGLAPLEQRARQARLLIDGYGLEGVERVGFVTRMIEYAVHSARYEAVVCHVTPTAPSPAPNGFPTLWAITWRVKAAAWMLEHRSALEAVLET
jgi:hypothetical protein